MNFNSMFFPEHRSLIDIKADLRTARRNRTDSVTRKLPQNALDHMQTIILKLLIEYAESDHNQLSLSMMLMDRQNEDYFVRMRMVREKRRATLDARQALLQFEHSIS